MFKNVFKLLISNFASFWKILTYKLIVVVIVGGLFCLTLSQLNSLSSLENLTNQVLALFDHNLAHVFNPTNNSLYWVLVALGDVVLELIQTAPFVFSYLVFLLFVLLPYLWHLSDFAVSEELYGFISSQSKTGFTRSLIRHLGTSSKYSIMLTIILFFLNIIVGCVIVGLILLSNTSAVVHIAIAFLILLVTTLYLSLRMTTLSSWASAITTTGCGVLQGLKKSLKSCKLRFFSYWSNAIFIVLLAVVLVMITNLWGLIVISPLYCLLISIYGIIQYFESNGLRYYVDFDTIISPKKFEQTDKLKKLKNII